jgi:hypothetical protein
MSRLAAAFLSLCFVISPALGQTASQNNAQQSAPVKPELPPELAAPQDEGEDLTAPPEGYSAEDPGVDENTPDEISIGEIPDITVIELTPDIAARAIDAFAVVREKFQDANLWEFENLQDFVDQSEEGKRFDADIKAAGFASVNDWNAAITTVGIAYSALEDDPTVDVEAQISEIQSDGTIAQDLKDRMVRSLKAMIPSANNKKVVQAMVDNQAYAEKLKLLAEDGE